MAGTLVAVRVLVDVSIVELFVAGAAATTRVYPKQTDLAKNVRARLVAAPGVAPVDVAVWRMRPVYPVAPPSSSTTGIPQRELIGVCVVAGLAVVISVALVVWGKLCRQPGERPSRGRYKRLPASPVNE